MTGDPIRFRRRREDPGEDWAVALLGPLRRESAEIDVAAAVMRRIALARPEPAPAALPERWAKVSLAATLALGFIALGLLVATAGVMAFGGEQEARSLWALVISAGRLASHGYSHAGSVVLGLGMAAIAILKGAWLLVATAAPLIRGAGFVAALGGVLSIAISLFVFSRARITAPVAERRSFTRLNGGFS